jgi:type II secretory pathway pseudopilin PulG
MTNEQLLIIVLGIIAVILTGAIAYAQKTRKSELLAIAALFQGALDAIIKRADVVLATQGNVLAPVHDALEVSSTLVDDPGDWLIKALANVLHVTPEAVIAGLKPIIEHGMALTDGAPEPVQETAPEQGFGTVK